VLPGQVYLQSLAMQSPAPFAPAASTTAPTAGATTGATAGPTAFTATGVASSHVRVALVLDRLASLPWLSNVTLVSSTSSASGTGGTLARGDTFAVSADLNPTGGAK
jgi:Tfp pilus assembly protein PilN